MNGIEKWKKKGERGKRGKRGERKAMDAGKGENLSAIKSYGVLHRKAYNLLLDKARYSRGCISFKDVRQILSSLRPNKREVGQFLKELESAGFIQIVPYRGIKLREVRE